MNRWTSIALLGLLAGASCAHGDTVEGVPAIRAEGVELRSGSSSQYAGEPPYPGPCVKRADRLGDGSVDWQLVRSYTADGRVLDEVYDAGADRTADKITRFRYEEGRLHRKQQDTDIDGNPDIERRLQYTDDGRLAQLSVDLDGNDPPEKIFRFEYDDQGRRTRKVADYGNDGSTDAVWRFEYGAEGRLTEKIWNQDAEGPPEEVLRYRYDDRGRKVAKILDQGNDGVVEKKTRFEYGVDGRVVAKRVDEGGDGEPERVVRYEYEGDRRTRIVVDRGADGSPEKIVETTYDSEGNVTRKSWDSDGDGAVELVREYDYSCWE